MAAAASPEQPAPEALAAPVPAAAAAASAASSSSSAGDDDTQASFEEVEEIKNKYVKELASLRSALTLPCVDDVVLYRFLRGHKFDQGQAAKHLNHTLTWRKQHKLDELRKKAEKLEQKQFPFAEKVLAVHPHNICHGVDRKGQPLSVERLGQTNPYLMVRTVKFEEMLQYHFYHMESKASLVADMTAKGGKVVRTCKIMDLSGLGRQHLDRRGLVYFKKLIDLSQHAYPEMLGDLYIVNTPWIFSMCWKLVSPWLNDKTLSKIHILPNDKFKQMLREAIEPKHIPDFLGGECTCGAAAGQPSNCVPLRDPDAGLSTVQVGGRAKHEHRLRVAAEDFARMAAEIGKEAERERAAAAVAAAEKEEADKSGELEAGQGQSSVGVFCGVSVTYEFRTQKNDVAFEIRTRALAGPNYAAAVAESSNAAAAAASAPAAASASAASPASPPAEQSESSEWVVLKPSKRYSSDSEPVSGSFILSAPAEVMLVFDNSFSMFTGKTVLFRVDTLAAVEHADDADEANVREQIQKRLSVGGGGDEGVFSPSDAVLSPEP